MPIDALRRRSWRNARPLTSWSTMPMTGPLFAAWYLSRQHARNPGAECLTPRYVEGVLRRTGFVVDPMEIDAAGHQHENMGYEAKPTRIPGITYCSVPILRDRSSVPSLWANSVGDPDKLMLHMSSRTRRPP